MTDQRPTTVDHRQSGANKRLVKYHGNEKDGISLAEPMHILPTKDRIALIETVRVPNILDVRAD